MARDFSPDKRNFSFPHSVSLSRDFQYHYCEKTGLRTKEEKSRHTVWLTDDAWNVVKITRGPGRAWFLLLFALFVDFTLKCLFRPWKF